MTNKGTLLAGKIFNIDLHRYISYFCDDKDIKPTKEIEDISLDFLQFAWFGKQKGNCPKLEVIFQRRFFLMRANPYPDHSSLSESTKS
jgi:hypothetical protein